MAINVLPPKVYNRIAAGEVVENPASVVKELVENSIDAGAKKIKIEIQEGGIKKICVSDDGCGIAKDDLPLAFLPHATSKVKSVEDLQSIETLGFRGEALASIASVSMVTLSTCTDNEGKGYLIKADGGDISKIEEAARLKGTTLTVQNLFFNTPARAKFLRKPKTEELEVTHLVQKFMFAHPEIDLVYVVDGKEIYNHSSGTLPEVAYLIYGREVHDALLTLSHQEDGVKVEGFIVSPKVTKPNRTYQSLFVNGRYVENYMISACVQSVYQPVVMKGRYPIYVLKLEILPERVDVNVHPSKKEVKFENQSKIFGIIRRAVENALLGANLIANFGEVQEWEESDLHNKTNQDLFSVERMAKDEGASYRVKVDTDEVEKPVVSDKALQKNGIEKINVPDFAGVKADKRKNRPGSGIFFDQSGDSLLHEVEISVKNELKQEKNAQMPAENQLNTSKISEEKFLKVDADEIKVVGVVFKTYIITEFQEAIYVIDQHAMHERQNYDRLKAQVEKNNVAKQDLLLPFEINTNEKERMILEDKLANLKQIGFEIEQNGNLFKVLSVPFVLAGMNLKNFLQEILSDEHLGQLNASGLINDKLCQSACKHSIRAGDSVSKDEILYLIGKIKDGVPLCPHGRPIIAKITRNDLEKMFKRVL